MAQSQERDLAQVVRERVDVEPVERFELRVRGPTGAHEVRVVGVRKAVGVGAGCREHSLLLEYEDHVDGADGDEDVCNRLGSLGVGGRVRSPLLHMELAAEARRERSEEARAVRFGRADLEVRSSRAAEGARAE